MRVVPLQLRFRTGQGDAKGSYTRGSTFFGRETLKDLVRNIAKVIDIPFTVGGGVGEVQHARDILEL